MLQARHRPPYGCWLSGRDPTIGRHGGGASRSCSPSTTTRGCRARSRGTSAGATWQDHRIVRAESGRQALEALPEIKLRGDPVAVLLADYRMPEMVAWSSWSRPWTLFPHARRALLTALRRTPAPPSRRSAIWTAYPAEAVGPARREALPGDGRADRAVAHPWNGAGHRDPGRGPPLVDAFYEVRDFLARNSVSCRWLNADEPEGPEAAGGGRARRDQHPAGGDARGRLAGQPGRRGRPGSACRPPRPPTSTTP